MEHSETMKLQESIKMISLGLLVLTCFVAVFVWTDINPSPIAKQFRIFTVISALLSIGGIIWSFTRFDLAPDFLAQISTPYFDCRGFCFLVDIICLDQKAYFRVFYQNRQDRECHARLAFRSRKSLFTASTEMKTTQIRVYSPPAAFGLEIVPVTLPDIHRLRYLDIEVGASIEYPCGIGKTLRFKEGVAVRFDSDFRNDLAVGATVVGGLGGKYITLSPASVQAEVFHTTKEVSSRTLRLESQVLWQLGDSPEEVISIH